MLALLFGLLIVAPALPARVDAPAVHAGDSWQYKNIVEEQGRFRETHDAVSVVRLQGDAMLLRTQQVDSTLQPSEVLIGGDWSRFRSIDGKEQVVARPFAFPLVAAKKWTVDVSESHPNRDHAREHIVTTYRVVGPERVTVPAGTFDAIKVEATGQWTATIAPAVGGTLTTRTDEAGAVLTNRIDRRVGGEATGRLYRAFWYVPAVKRAVKVIEETYSAGGTRTEARTAELESFKLAE